MARAARVVVSRVRCRDRRQVAGAGAGAAAGMQLLRLQAAVNSVHSNLQAARDLLHQIRELIDFIDQGVSDFGDPRKAQHRGTIETATRSAIGECSGIIRDHFSPNSTLDMPLKKVEAAEIDQILSTGPLDPIWLLLPPELVGSTLDVVEFVFGQLNQVWIHTRRVGIDVACLSRELPNHKRVQLEKLNNKARHDSRVAFADGAVDRTDMGLDLIDDILEEIQKQPPEFFSLGE